MIDYSKLARDELILCALEERERFRKDGDRKAPACVELTRRALWGDDAEMQRGVMLIMDQEVLNWAKAACNSRELWRWGKEPEDLRADAYKRFFKALSEKDMKEFSNEDDNLAPFTAYLQKIIHNSALGITRNRPPVLDKEILYEPEVHERSSSYSSHADSDLFLEQLRENVCTSSDKNEREKEFLVFDHTFTNTKPLSPRHLIEMHPEIFTNTKEIYRIKDRLIKRIKKEFDEGGASKEDLY